MSLLNVWTGRVRACLWVCAVCLCNMIMDVKCRSAYVSLHTGTRMNQLTERHTTVHNHITIRSKNDRYGLKNRYFMNGNTV